VAIEGSNIVPDRSRIQDLFFHPRHEDGCSVGVPFDVHHTAVAGAKRESEAKIHGSNPGT
jgi:hypothetical protein